MCSFRNYSARNAAISRRLSVGNCHKIECNQGEDESREQEDVQINLASMSSVKQVIRSWMGTLYSSVGSQKKCPPKKMVSSSKFIKQTNLQTFVHRWCSHQLQWSGFSDVIIHLLLWKTCDPTVPLKRAFIVETPRAPSPATPPQYPATGWHTGWPPLRQCVQKNTGKTYQRNPSPTKKGIKKKEGQCIKSLQIIDIVGVRDVPVWSKYQFFKKVLHRFLRQYVIFFSPGWSNY